MLIKTGDFMEVKVENIVKKDQDMISGNLFKKIIFFSIPLILTTLLQLLYSSADLIIISGYKGHNSMSAVGSTGSLINLIITLFIGISTGASVVISQSLGRNDKDKCLRTSSSAIILSLISGLIVV